MIPVHIQLNAVNNGLSIFELVTLDVLLKAINEISEAEIKNSLPFFFSTTLHVRKVVAALEEKDYVEILDKVDTLYHYKLNVSKVKDVYATNTKIKVKQVKVSTTKDEPINEYKNIYSSYNTSGLRKIRVNIGTDNLIKKHLETYTLEQIEDAMRFAVTQQWIINKAGENWCNINWILGKLNEFMEGGKYNRNRDLIKTSLSDEEFESFI